jgi:hypothetical protein
MLVGHVDIATRFGVSGWAADDSKPDENVTVQIFVDGQKMCAVRADAFRGDLQKLGKFGGGNHGFCHIFRPELSIGKEHTVEVRYANNGTPLPDGRRVLLVPVDALCRQAVAPDLDLSPVLVRAMGRAGTSVFMQHLSTHPQIVVGGRMPFELMLCAYYSTALRAITSPGDWKNSIHPDQVMNAQLSVGFNPYYHLHYEVFRSHEDTGAFQQAYVTPLVTKTFSQIIAKQYSLMADEQEKPTAIYFAEKFGLSKSHYERQLAMFPDTKEILIVRDVRDAYCSFRSYFKLQGEDLLTKVKAAADNVCAAYFQKRGASTLFIKYEDMVLNKAETFDRVSSFLGIENNFTIGNDADAKLFSVHATSGSPDRSIGRWQKELSEMEVNTLERELSKYQSTFQYAQ